MKMGDFVALAKVGAKLPNGVAIKASKIRGEASEGMLCSDSELKFSEESDGILILPGNSVPGMELAQALGRNDAVLTLELTPNRGDLLSMIGVAREVAAALNVSPKIPGTGAEGSKDGKLQAFVHDTTGAPRYALRHLEGIKVGPSPDWLKHRLLACGVRAINNVVDVTNYVMLEWGQPLHAFDTAKVKGAVAVRRAKEGEKILSLDGIERKLSTTDLVIADDAGPIAIAGVMGGEKSGVTEATQAIYLESAYFDPKSVRLTARKLNCHSESSHRFERGIDPTGVWNASDRAVDLYAKVAGAKEVSSVDLKGALPASRRISLRREMMERVLGQDIKKSGEYLARLGFSVEKREETFLVDVPARRSDLEREIDLVEEVARIHGFNQFESALPALKADPTRNASYEFYRGVTDLMVQAGFQECRTYSFAPEIDLSFGNAEKPVRVVNPIAEGMEWMRTSLAPSLIKVWKTNESRQKKGARLFEIGTVFSEGEEKTHLVLCCAGLQTKKNWNSPDRNADFYDIKGAVEFLFGRLGLGGVAFEPSGLPSYLHPGQSVSIVFRKRPVGWAGILHPKAARAFDVGNCALAEVDLSPLLAAGVPISRFKSLSPFPVVERDMAFIVKRSISAENFVQEIKKLKDPLLLDVELFDLFEGKGMGPEEKSLAFTFSYGLPDRTLTEAEVEESMKKTAKHLEVKLLAKLRGEIS